MMRRAKQPNTWSAFVCVEGGFERGRFEKEVGRADENQMFFGLGIDIGIELNTSSVFVIMSFLNTYK